MVKVILSTNDRSTLDVLKRYVEPQGEEDIENKCIERKEDNNCHLCGWK
jgi:hypothetical protein